jgi:hypothetical protein
MCQERVTNRSQANQAKKVPDTFLTLSVLRFSPTLPAGVDLHASSIPSLRAKADSSSRQLEKTQRQASLVEASRPGPESLILLKWTGTKAVRRDHLNHPQSYYSPGESPSAC